MIFSKGLYFQGIKKIRAAGIGAAITLLIINSLYAYILTDFSWKNNINKDPEILTGGMIAPFAFFILFFTYPMVTSMFSYLGKRKGSDFYHSIPQKRICVYLSFLAAICTWITAIVFSTIVTNSLVFSLDPDYKISILGAFLAFLGYTVSAFVACGVVIIGRMLAGTKISCVFYTACILLIPRLIMELFKSHLSEINATIPINQTWLKIISLDKSFYFVFGETLNESLGGFGSPDLMIGLFVESLILFAFGAYLYIRRKSELAGQKSSSRIVQVIFRSGATTPLVLTALMFLLLESDSMIPFVCFMVLALLVHFLFELILSKNVQKALASLPLFIIPVIISILTLSCSYATAEGFRRTEPKADEVESISIIQTERWASHEIMFLLDKPNSSNEAINYSLDNLKKYNHASDTYISHRLSVKFKLKNGREKYRTLYFTEDEYTEFINIFHKLYPYYQSKY